MSDVNETPPAADSSSAKSNRQTFGKWAIVCLTIAATFAALGLVINAVSEARKSARKNLCRAHLRHIGLSLADYHRQYGSLPPAYVTDPKGTPTHSWRTLISPYIFYNLEVDYFSQLDLGKPWNDAANEEILKKYVGTGQCPSDERLGSDMTHYVAVVGEGTLWPGATSEKLPESSVAIGKKPVNALKEKLPRILVVDWPDSDVKWTEPRDIVKEEFLQWFRDRQKETRTNHDDVILYLGDDLEVHELTLDTDPEEVEKLLTGDHSK